MKNKEVSAIDNHIELSFKLILIKTPYKIIVLNNYLLLIRSLGINISSNFLTKNLYKISTIS